MITDMHVHLMGDNGARLLASASHCGIGRLIVSDLADWSEFPEENAIRAGNDRAAAFAAGAPGRVFFLAYVNPQLDSAEEELQRCVQQGAVGVKLWISLRDEANRLDRAAEILHLAARQGLPVLVHTFSRTDALLRGELDAARFLELARMAPECTLIGAHLGGNWRSTLALAEDLPDNVYWDVCGGYPAAGMVEAALAQLGPERLLWGSDAPGRSFGSQLAKVWFAEMSAEARALILNGNAERIFHLPPGGEAILPEPPEGGRELPDEGEEHFVFCGDSPLDGRSGVTPEALEKLLIRHGVRCAYAVSLDSFRRQDLHRVNAAFLAGCAGLTRVVPLAAINPRQTGWRGVLAAARKGGFRGLWISPYVHAWRPDAPEFAEFRAALAASGLPVWLNAAVEDYRFRPSGWEPRPVMPGELAAFAGELSGCPLVIQGMEVTKDLLALLPAGGNWRLEYSRLTDREERLPELCRQGARDRLVCGSEYPFRAFDETRLAARWLMKERHSEK